MIASVAYWFLTVVSDFIPDQLEGVSWILCPSKISKQSNPIETEKPKIDLAQNHADKYEMDEVFDVEGAGRGDYGEDDDDYEDDIEYFKFSDRYQLT